MRTLQLTSPFMHGPDVTRLQKLLRAKGWYRDTVDSQYGPVTAQAVYRAKYWLGYSDAQLARDGHAAGDLLRSYLELRRHPTPEMQARTRLRMHPAQPPVRVQALHLLTGKLGVKENPAGSNVCWASDWYDVTGPWCAMSVTWAYVLAGSHTFQRGQRYAYVPYVVADARAGRNHLSLTTDPKPGDLVCYDWNRDGTADHMGLFERWADDHHTIVVAVEGNTSSDDQGNQSNGGEVCRKHRSRTFVQAFVHVGA